MLLREGPNTVRGRLVLEEDGGRVTGQLLLETSDSAPVPVTGTLGSDGAIELHTAAASPLTLSGELRGDRLAGVVTPEGGRTWSAERLAPGVEYYPAPPRFRARQILLDARPEFARLAGIGTAAARATGDSSGAVLAAYRSVSVAAGLVPLDESGLRRDDLLFAMGLLHRSEMLRASRAVLRTIRGGLSGDTLLARFDHLFRPHGRWIVDVHDDARERVIAKFPDFTWEALGAVTTLPEVVRERLPNGVDSVPLGLYRLYVLSTNEPELYTLRLEELRRVDPTSAAGVERYVQAYTEAAEWYRSVIEFFVTRPWFDGRSLAALVADAWPWPADVVPPAVRTRGYGYPEGSPRVMPVPTAVARVVVPENRSAQEWLARHGEQALLDALGDLPREPSNTVLDEAAGSWLVTSIAQRREDDPTGFLEPENAVVLDPSYVPTLALGTVVHEWLHILHERRRAAITLYATATRDTVARYRTPALVPAEGLAEWLTDVVMAPIARRYPLLGLGEAAKRATMALTRPGDPHLAGYLIARNVAGLLNDRPATVALFLAGMNDPDSILRHRRVARAWAPYRGGVTTLIEVTASRWLVPETTFLIDDRTVFMVRRRLIPTAP
jgi:hypothetical protein